jgi:hypothetical protein
MSSQKKSSDNKRLRSGVCKFCGCTNAKGCVLGYYSHAGTAGQLISEQTMLSHPIMCSWFNVERTVCTKASCVENYLKASKPSRPAANTTKGRRTA